MNSFVTSQLGIQLIQHFEGCFLTAYPDPATGGDPWTIGWGHTGSDVYPGLTITQDQADALLAQDLSTFENSVNNAVTSQITQNVFDSLVSFSYNLGSGALLSSTLLKQVNNSDFSDAVHQFVRWDNGPNGPMAGLVLRRKAEAYLFANNALNFNFSTDPSVDDYSTPVFGS